MNEALPISLNDLRKNFITVEEYCHDLSKGKLLNTEAAGNSSKGWNSNDNTIRFNESIKNFKYLRIDLLCHEAAIHTYYVYVPTFLEKLYDDGTKYNAKLIPLCNGQDGAGWYICGCNSTYITEAYFPSDTKWTYAQAYGVNTYLHIYGFK